MEQKETLLELEFLKYCGLQTQQAILTNSWSPSSQVHPIQIVITRSQESHSVPILTWTNLEKQFS